jgi:phenylalanine-4-hydroxylase
MLNDDYLYKPEWGTYDLACGCKIVSVFGGPADWRNYFNWRPTPSSEIHQSSNLDKDNAELNELYKIIKEYKKNNRPNIDYIPVLNKLNDNYPEDWLLCMEIYEIIIKDPDLTDEIINLRQYLNKFAKNNNLSDTIGRGLEIIEKT